MSDIRYYLIRKRQLGKYDNGKYYLFHDGNWEEDTDGYIFGILNGYDPFEPEDSPYGWGSTSVMEEIEEIDEKEAKRIIRG